MSDNNHRKNDKSTRRRAATSLCSKRGKAHKRGITVGYSSPWLTYDMILPNHGEAKGRKRWKKKRSRKERRVLKVQMSKDE